MDGLLGLEHAFLHRAIGRGQVLDQEVQEDGFFVGDRIRAQIDVGFEDSRERRGGVDLGPDFPVWGGQGQAVGNSAGFVFAKQRAGGNAMAQNNATRS